MALTELDRLSLVLSQHRWKIDIVILLPLGQILARSEQRLPLDADQKVEKAYETGLRGRRIGLDSQNAISQRLDSIKGIERIVVLTAGSAHAGGGCSNDYDNEQQCSNAFVVLEGVFAVRACVRWMYLVIPTRDSHLPTTIDLRR